MKIKYRPEIDGLRGIAFVAAMGGYLHEGDLTIHHIRLNDDFDKIIYSSVIPIGERIRDLSFLENENKIIMILENTPSIGIIEKSVY